MQARWCSDLLLELRPTEVVQVGQTGINDEDQERNGLLVPVSGWNRQVHFGAACHRTEDDVAEAEKAARERLHGASIWPKEL